MLHAGTKVFPSRSRFQLQPFEAKDMAMNVSYVGHASHRYETDLMHQDDMD